MPVPTGRRKVQFAQFEIGQCVHLARPILRYSDAWRGIEFNPPQVLFPVGAEATILQRTGDSYLISLADGTFVIRRHATSLDKVSK